MWLELSYELEGKVGERNQKGKVLATSIDPPTLKLGFRKDFTLQVIPREKMNEERDNFLLENVNPPGWKFLNLCMIGLGATTLLAFVFIFFKIG